MQKSVAVKVGQRFPLTIKRLGINGEGIGYFKRKITFIPGALPGEEVVAEITHVSERFLNAKIHQFRKKSPARVQPKDPQFGRVGGIELEDLAYPEQLKFKQDVIVQSLEKFKPAGYKNYQIKPSLGMKVPYYYRNKAQFQVREINRRVMAGLFAPNSHKLIDLKTFATQTDLTMKVMRKLVALIQQFEIPVYNEKKNTGCIKTLVLRQSFATDEIQVTFVTNTPQIPRLNTLLNAMTRQLPEVTSIVQNINPGRTSLIWGDETKVIAGNETITEEINGRKYELSARAFFQLNPTQTAKLYQLAGDALELNDQDTLVDAYCGVGTIGIALADQVKAVRGMDITPASIEDAKKNAALNNVTNVTYEVGKAEDLLPKWLKEGFKPTALVVDPPRTGLDDKLIAAILENQPKKFVYVSCNPSTMARDLVRLTEKYSVEWIKPVDMFPQTARVEAVVKLKLK